MEIEIRKFELQDYDRVSEIMNQVQKLHVNWRPDVYKPTYPLITKEAFDEMLKGDNWYVAVVDGIVAGILEIIVRHIESPSHVTKDILYISTMAVDEAYRGQGIGHKFFDMIKQLKKKKGYDSIELQVNASNEKAYNMYKNYGFTEKSINMELK